MSAWQEKGMRFLILCCVMALPFSAPVYAQEEELPTLKLDRIPSSPAFSGQTRAPAANPSTYIVETVAFGALVSLGDGIPARWRNSYQ